MKQLLSTFLILLAVNFSFSQTNFAAKQTIDADTGNNPYTIASGHIDGDSHLDILVGTDVDNIIVWYKGNGDGTFTKQSAITNTLINIVGIKLVDLNGDTELDILAVGFGDYDFSNYGVGSSLVWFANDGSGNFGSEQVLYNSHNGLSGLFVGNIDSGSTPDIAFTSYAQSQVFWLSNDGSGTFTGPTTIDNTLSFPGAVNMKDIDNDGDLDALIATGAAAGNDVVEIFRNDLVPGGSVAWTKDATSVTTGKNYLFNATFEDLDGDANLDILITELNTSPGTGGFYWVEEDGLGGYTETEITTSIGNPSVAQHRDLDGDGDKDIILSSGAAADTNDIVWFINDGSGNYGSEVVIDNTQSQAYVYTIADFDGDLDLDIASNSFNEDQLNYFENELYTLSNTDFNVETVSVFPIPAKTNLNFEGLLEETSVSIYNILGKVVMNTTINPNHPLDISSLTSGVYLLKMNDSGITKRIVKQ